MVTIVSSAPHEYPAQSLVAANTHDLPTLRSFWRGSDLALRESLNLFPSENMCAEQMQERAFDRDRLLQALANDSLLSHEAKDAYRESAAIDEAPDRSHPPIPGSYAIHDIDRKP